MNMSWDDNTKKSNDEKEVDIKKMGGAKIGILQWGVK